VKWEGGSGGDQGWGYKQTVGSLGRNKKKDTMSTTTRNKLIGKKKGKQISAYFTGGRRKKPRGQSGD